jgi:hypothetical protein
MLAAYWFPETSLNHHLKPLVDDHARFPPPSPDLISVAKSLTWRANNWNAGWRGAKGSRRHGDPSRRGRGKLHYEPNTAYPGHL